MSKNVRQRYRKKRKEIKNEKKYSERKMREKGD